MVTFWKSAINKIKHRAAVLLPSKKYYLILFEEQTQDGAILLVLQLAWPIVGR